MTDFLDVLQLAVCLLLAMLLGGMIITAPLWLPAALLVWWLT